MLGWGLVLLGVGAALLIGGAMAAGKHPEGSHERHRARYTVPAAVGAALMLVSLVVLATAGFEAVVVAVTS